MLHWNVKNEIVNLLKNYSSYCFYTWLCLSYAWSFLLADGILLKNNNNNNKTPKNKKRKQNIFNNNCVRGQREMALN